MNFWPTFERNQIPQTKIIIKSSLLSWSDEKWDIDYQQKAIHSE